MIRTFFLVGLLTLAGCGGGAIVEHARAAQLVSPIITAAGVAVRAARAAELDACATATEPAACLDAGEASWAPALVAYNLTREGYVAWVEGMSLAALSQMNDTDAGAYLAPLFLALLNLYEGIRMALDPITDLELPAIPALGLGR